jgi:hypothetical protein
VFPDLPRPLPFGQDKPGASHATDGLIGSMNHHNPYIHPSPTYGVNQYPQPYGRISYYSPPTHPQPYPVVPPLPLGGSLPVPPMHSISQPSMGPPPTPTCDCTVLEALQLIIHHMDCLHKTIHISHFLVLRSRVLPHQNNHMPMLILFNPLLLNIFMLLNNCIQKIHPISRIMPRRKEKNETITTRDLEEITPNKTIPTGETRTPKGETTTNDQGITC